MDQKRAGQLLFLTRCLAKGDTSVSITIERTFRESTQRDVDGANEAVVVLEADLASLLELLQTATTDEARLVQASVNISSLTTNAAVAAATAATAATLAQIRSQLEEVRSRSSRVRTLRLSLGKEQKRAQKLEADARAGGYGVADACRVAFQLFEFGYFPDIWTGHEQLLPLGVTKFVAVVV